MNEEKIKEFEAQEVTRLVEEKVRQEEEEKFKKEHEEYLAKLAEEDDLDAIQDGEEEQ